MIPSYSRLAVVSHAANKFNSVIVIDFCSYRLRGIVIIARIILVKRMPSENV
jgi:hypothetical protein